MWPHCVLYTRRIPIADRFGVNLNGEKHFGRKRFGTTAFVVRKRIKKGDRIAAIVDRMPMYIITICRTNKWFSIDAVARQVVPTACRPTVVTTRERAPKNPSHIPMLRYCDICNPASCPRSKQLEWTQTLYGRSRTHRTRDAHTNVCFNIRVLSNYKTIGNIIMLL